MKRSIGIIAFLFLVTSSAVAQAPTVNPQSNNGAWLRTGNSAPPATNVIGTFFPSPMYFYTNGFLRLRINHNISNSVNSLPAQARNGYIGIGNDLNGIWSNPASSGPFSLLHLNGNGSFVQAFGYRNWMQTGISFTSNNDFAYVGQKQNGPPALDETDLVIAWSDNAGTAAGPDVLKFVFTSGSGAGNNDLNGDHPNGREILRMHGNGNIGIGPRFTNTAPPQSQLHINAENSTNAGLQLTTQNAPVGQTASDGLLLRVSGANGDARVDQQENASLLFFTGTSAGGGERMRISSVSTPPTPNPAGLLADVTRVSIAHRSASPVTRPLSLLHLGYDTTNAATNNGWRGWMDVGTFTSMFSDHLYVGLKREYTTVAGDRHDAVIGWGDNADVGSPITRGPDYLRFIFTSTLTDPLGGPAALQDGLEVMRLTPDGNVGIGDYLNTTPMIGAKLDIAGDLRIRSLAQNNNLDRVLVADQGDLNRVRWRDASSLCYFACGSSVAGSQLPATSWWQLNDFNFIFAGQGGPNNSVGIGTSCAPTAKLHVSRQLVAPAVPGATALRVEHSDVSAPAALLGIGTGVGSTITGANRLNYAGDFAASGANQSTGVRGFATSANFTSIGGYFIAGGAPTNIGLWASAPAGNTAGLFTGNVFRTGTDNFTSDRRLKRDVAPIKSSIEILRRLQPKTFYFDSAANPRLSLPRERQYGLIAQDVAEVLPEVVHDVTIPAGGENEEAATYKSVNYEAFIPLLIDALQKQQAEIAELRAQVSALRK